MTNQDHTDPVKQAVDIATMKESLAGMKQQVTDGFQNVGRTLDGLQQQCRDLAQGMSTVAQQRQGMESQASAIQKIADDFAAWRKGHEDDNNKVAEDVTGFKGAMRGIKVVMGIVFILGSALVSLALWSFNQQLNGMDKDRARIESKMDAQYSDLQMANKITNDRITALRNYP